MARISPARALESIDAGAWLGYHPLMSALSSPAQHWYRSAFGRLAAAFWTELIPQARIDDEARFLAAGFAARPRGRLLDLPCGAGRHARALARLGWKVEGFDLSPAMLGALPDQPGDGVALAQGDMITFSAVDRYDGGYCWGNSFGYFSHADSHAFLRNVARALKPGAAFALDYGAVAENLLPSFQPRTELAAAGFRFTAERRYDLAEGVMHIHYRIERGDEIEQFEAAQAVYTTAQVVAMADRAGLALASLHGGIAGEPAAIGRPLVGWFRRRDAIAV
jgi:SAM-dependent methyltransferase